MQQGISRGSSDSMTMVLVLFLTGALAGLLPPAASPVTAQVRGADDLILEGKEQLQTGLDSNDLDVIRRARALFERATADPNRSSLTHYYVALADYRLANLLYGTDRRQTLSYLNDSVEHLKEAIRINDRFAEAHALLSGSYGQKIGLSPLESIILGPKSGKAIERATELEPDNPRVVLLKAISDYHTPKMFGGDREQAMAGFQRAAELFDEELIDDPLQPDWGHDEVYAWIGMAHNDAGAYELAREAYEKALAINPDFGWVKYVLQPQLPPQPARGLSLYSPASGPPEGAEAPSQV